MKTIYRQTAVLIFTLISAVAGFAASNNNLTAAIETQNVAALRNRQIPPAVLDNNFRRWQPSPVVPLIPAQINDIMMTDGYKIYYNPAVVSRTPPKIVAFFLAHEYGHIHGGNEFQADQFAARVYAETDIGVVKAAIWHFYNIQGNMCDMSHGCGWQRALNIGQTAGFSENEISSIVRGNF